MAAARGGGRGRRGEGVGEKKERSSGGKAQRGLCPDAFVPIWVYMQSSKFRLANSVMERRAWHLNRGVTFGSPLPISRLRPKRTPAFVARTQTLSNQSKSPRKHVRRRGARPPIATSLVGKSSLHTLLHPAWPGNLESVFCERWTDTARAETHLPTSRQAINRQRVLQCSSHASTTTAGDRQLAPTLYSLSPVSDANSLGDL